MTYLQMSYILEVGKHLSFTQAAEHLYVSQSAISKQVSAFEKEIGFPLFVRNRQKLTITPEGEKVLALLEKQEHKTQDTIQQISKIRRGISRTISVGFYPSLFNGDALGRACARLHEDYPDIDLEYNCINRDTLTGHAENYDLLLCFESDCPQFTEYEHCRLKALPMSLMVGARHPLALKESLSYDDFNNIPVFYVDKMRGMKCGESFAKRNCAAAGRPESDYVRYLVSVPDACSMYMNVEAGLGIAFCPYDESLMAGRNIKLYPMPDLLEYVVAMWLPSKAEKALLYFIDLLTEND